MFEVGANDPKCRRLFNEYRFNTDSIFPSRKWQMRYYRIIKQNKTT